MSRRRVRERKEEAGISVKTEAEIRIVRRAGRIVAEVLRQLSELARPGVTTGELDRAAEAGLLAAGATPAFKGYQGFPASLCASVNDEVVHGIPGPRELQVGDIISLDLGAVVGGWYADAAVTVAVGEVSAEARRLLGTTREALQRGIAQAREGNRVFDISAAIQGYVEARGYSVVRDLVGHGIGRAMHEPPQVPDFVMGGPNPVLRAGMTICIEPMVNTGTWELMKDPDGWTLRTRDGGLSAHFEHTVAIGRAGAEVLTIEGGTRQTTVEGLSTRDRPAETIQSG